LRAAMPQDVLSVYAWIRDPDVRRGAFDPKEISVHEHQNWFQNKLLDSESLYRIAETEKKELIGQVRVQKRKELTTAFDISIVVAPEFRAQGYGLKMLQRMELEVASRPCEFHAYVRVDNPASQAIFIRAGYLEIERTSVHDIPAIHLLRVMSI